MSGIKPGANCRREQTQGRGKLRLRTLLARIYFTKADLGEVFTEVMQILEDVRMEADLLQIAQKEDQVNPQHYSNEFHILGNRVKVQFIVQYPVQELLSWL